MLFTDGCFLLQLIAIATDDGAGASFGSRYRVTELLPILLVDIFIVENQIPWIVLSALMSVRPVQVMRFIDMLVAGWFDKRVARPGHAWGERRRLQAHPPPGPALQAADRAGVDEPDAGRPVQVQAAGHTPRVGLGVGGGRRPDPPEPHPALRRHTLPAALARLRPLSASSAPALHPNRAYIINMMAFELLYSQQPQGR